MPYDSLNELPDSVKNNLPKHAQEIYQAAYDKAFEVTMNGDTHTFDSFECAMEALAPTCAHCGGRVIGHGMEQDDTIYCCAHCARQEGVKGLKDRV